MRSTELPIRTGVTDTSLPRQFRVRLTRTWPWGRSTKFWHRLAYGFAALLILTVVVVVVAVLQFRALAQHSERMLQVDFPRMLKVQAVHQHAQGHGSAMARLLTSPRANREAVYPEADAEYHHVDRVLNELTQQIDDEESRQLLATVVLRREQYRSVFIEVASTIEANDIVRASALFNGPGLTALSHLLAASEALLAHERRELERRHSAMLGKILNAEWILAALALASLLASAMLAWRITVSIARPLARVEAAARAIAQGRYNSRIDVRGGAEFTRVAQAINGMADAVAAREREIEQQAFADRLTGLPTRTWLMQRAPALQWSRAAVIHIDLARLRIVNDVLGFEAGDGLLMRLADRLRSLTHLLDTSTTSFALARLEGGVFVCVCNGLSRNELEALRSKMDATLSGSMQFAHQTIDVRLVYGLSAYACRAQLPLETLLREAEQAAAEAKRQQQPWSWYFAGDAGARARQLGLLSGLEHAAASGELEMWLQPKLKVATGEIVGMEALVRWHHHESGYVAPAEFIPFAEQTGHIGIVTRAMLEQALATLGRWVLSHAQLSIAVNVSTLDIRDATLPDRIRAMAEHHRAPLGRLKLEITESGLMEHTNRVLPVLQALRDLGIQLSIDDFGTGYSSLAYLHRLPVNELKIDRSFVSHADDKPEAAALLRTIIELGHSLKLTVVAEGVERAEEQDLLTEFGCDQIQGYIVGKPMSLTDLESFLAA